MKGINWTVDPVLKSTYEKGTVWRISLEGSDTEVRGTSCRGATGDPPASSSYRGNSETQIITSNG